jgi:hypothetical protein
MATQTIDQVARPSLSLFVTEPARGAISFAALPLAARWLARAPHTDPHGVLVLPGLMASDASTGPLRRYLRRLGHRARGWHLGRNVGPSREILQGMPLELDRLANDTGRAVSLIGWSLGGVYARELARQHPSLVRQVITLGSPFAMVDSRQSRVNGTYNRQAHQHVNTNWFADELRRREPLPVPSTAVYSHGDGIVSWSACIQDPGPQHENVAVRCSHLGFGVDPATLWLIADRLALPVGEWRPFRPPQRLRALYPSR